LYVSSGVGLGGGIISNGRLLTGGNGLAGEVGHMSINPDGHLCKCGNRGCWETEATQAALFRHVQEQLNQGQRSLLSRWNGQITVRLVRDAALAGDEVALTAFEETGRWLGIGMANLINALNPKHVVFGGSMSIAYDLLYPHMRAEIEKRALSWIWKQAYLTTATHTADAALMGGVAMLHHHVIHHPNRWNTALETLS
jgi:predicted NBD/HSP70 family sugar kinase